MRVSVTSVSPLPSDHPVGIALMLLWRSCCSGQAPAMEPKSRPESMSTPWSKWPCDPYLLLWVGRSQTLSFRSLMTPLASLQTRSHSVWRVAGGSHRSGGACATHSAAASGSLGFVNTEARLQNGTFWPCACVSKCFTSSGGKHRGLSGIRRDVRSGQSGAPNPHLFSTDNVRTCTRIHTPVVLPVPLGCLEGCPSSRPYPDLTDHSLSFLLSFIAC